MFASIHAHTRMHSCTYPFIHEHMYMRMYMCNCTCHMSCTSMCIPCMYACAEAWEDLRELCKSRGEAGWICERGRGRGRTQSSRRHMQRPVDSKSSPPLINTQSHQRLLCSFCGVSRLCACPRSGGRVCAWDMGIGCAGGRWCRTRRACTSTVGTV